MTRSLEFRFAMIGLALGGIVALALYSVGGLFPSGSDGAGATVRGSDSNAGDVVRRSASAASVEEPQVRATVQDAPGRPALVAQDAPGSPALVAQYFLLDLKEPNEALDILGSIPDPKIRVASVQWLLEAPKRESDGSHPAKPEEALGKILQPLLDLVTYDCESLRSIEKQEDLDAAERCIDTMLLIAEFLRQQDEIKAANAAAKSAGRHAIRFAKLRPASFDQDDEPDNLIEALFSGNFPAALALVLPGLFGAFGFATATAIKPVLEAFGKAVGRRIADPLENPNRQTPSA